MFHSAHYKLLPWYLGRLSVPTRKNNNHSLIVDLLRKGYQRKLLIFGSISMCKTSGTTHSYFSEGLCNIANQPHIRTHVVILNPVAGEAMLISNPLLHVSINTITDTLNLLQQKIVFSHSGNAVTVPSSLHVYLYRDMCFLMLFIVLPIFIVVITAILIKVIVIKHRRIRASQLRLRQRAILER